MKFVVLLKKPGELAKIAYNKHCTVICREEEMYSLLTISEPYKKGDVVTGIAWVDGCHGGAIVGVYLANAN